MAQLQALTIRLPDEMLKRLPPASLDGHRSKWIREAVQEKLDREEEKRLKA